MTSHGDRELLVVNEYTEFILEEESNNNDSVDSRKSRRRTAAEILQQNLSATTSLSTQQLFWKKVLYHRNTTLAALSLLLLFIFITGVDIILYRSTVKDSVCSSKICVEIATDIKTSMNESYDPCWNFYKYVCGGWIDKHQLPKNETKQFSFLGLMDKQNVKVIRNILEKEDPLAISKAERKARDFYASCINQHVDESSQDDLYDDYNDELPEELLSNDTVFPNVVSFSNSGRFQSYKLRHNAIFQFRGAKTVMEDSGVRQSKRSIPESNVLRNTMGLTESDNYENHKSLNCTSQTIDNFPDVTARLFVLETFPPQKRSDSLEMYNIIKENYFKLIANATWMHPQSKKCVVQQFSNLTFVNGYPETIMDLENIDRRYENITISNNTYSKNIQSLKNDYIKRLFITYFNFERYVILANAFYHSNKDEILLLAGIVQKQIFDPAYPQIVNYARLGFALSHEMSHAFQYYYYNCTTDEECSYEPNDPRKCIEDFYNHLTINKNISVDGSATVQENFSDVAALKVSLTAYNNLHSQNYQKLPGLEEYTQNQLFFIATAQLQCSSMGSKENEDAILEDQVENDNHSPSSARVLGALANTKEFAEAFNCPVGNRYNPANKCPVF